MRTTCKNEVFLRKEKASIGVACRAKLLAGTFRKDYFQTFDIWFYKAIILWFSYLFFEIVLQILLVSAPEIKADE